MDGLNRLMDINVVEPVTIGAIASRLYFYYSYTHEVSGDLAEIRRALFGLHNVAILNHDELGQETLINMLLRNYLHYNLYDQAEKLRIGLRNISICYSSISLDDVADKLRMHSTNHVEDVENIVAKAISDGANEAKIDHANGWLTLKETGDIYSTAEPRAAFSSRIAFCLNLHNEADRAPLSMETSKSNTYGAQLALLAEENGKYL
ncbi:hypothetical protein Peur_014422 [Populus x canadensis]